MTSTMEQQELELRRKIQQAFRKSGWRQSRLVEATGWSQPEISYLLSEDNTRRFSVYRLQEVASALGLSVKIECKP